MNLKVLILPGDGIGAEVTREAVRVLETVASKFGHQVALTEGLLGGVAIHKTGTPLPDETTQLALEADATISGSGNQFGVDPLLGPLAGNGGPANSPAQLNSAHRTLSRRAESS